MDPAQCRRKGVRPEIGEGIDGRGRRNRVWTTLTAVAVAGGLIGLGARADGLRPPVAHIGGTVTLEAAATASGGAGARTDVDWPGWRGPDRNGITRETGSKWSWGTNGPAVAWRASVGTGFSSFAVVGGQVYTLGNSGGTDTVYCLSAATGEVRWRYSYACDPQPLSYEGGPSATPAVADGRVYTFSKEGHLFCLNAADGRVVWSKKFELWPWKEGDWRNTWRYASSPLVAEHRLYLSVGQHGIALDSRDGAVLWQSQDGHPGYSSPVPFRAADGAEAFAFFSGHAVFGIGAGKGERLWEVPWKTLWDLNAADPIVHDGRMFVSSGNGVGGALFDLGAQPPRELWRNKHLKTMMNSAVLWEGNLYGFNDTHLACIAWDTGEERWSTRDVRQGSVIVAAGKLVLLSETGKLVVAEATPVAYQPVATAQVLDGRCWTAPVLSGGRLFVRNAAGDAACLQVR